MKRNTIAYKITGGTDLITVSQRVIEKMANNPLFANPPAALAELSKQLPEYQDALVKAKSRDKQLVSIKNDKKAVIVALLTELANYVAVTCNGDRTSILSSGFDVSDERSGTPAPSIETLQVDATEAGVAVTRISNITGAKAYVHQYTPEIPNANTVWVSEGSSHRSYVFRGLTSDKRYWFRVMAIGISGQTAYSPVVSRAIQ